MQINCTQTNTTKCCNAMFYFTFLLSKVSSAGCARLIEDEVAVWSLEGRAWPAEVLKEPDLLLFLHARSGFILLLRESHFFPVKKMQYCIIMGQ